MSRQSVAITQVTGDTQDGVTLHGFDLAYHIREQLRTFTNVFSEFDVYYTDQTSIYVFLTR